MLVYDASALVAYLNDEPGGAVVEELLNDADVPQYVHAVNLLEVFYRFARRDDVLVAREAIADLRATRLQVRDDLDAELWQDAATLKSDHVVALGDCIGLALARRLGAAFVTADKGDLKTATAARVCPITLIR
jgi:predicted nucleic acid-binding protein